MIKHQLALTSTLDGYILASELMDKLGLCRSAYRFWDCLCAQYVGSKIVFLARDNLPAKYRRAAYECTDLSGLISVAAFCSLAGVAPAHFSACNNSALFSALRIIRVGRVKFVDLAGLYARLEIPKHAHIYIEKCRHFAPSPLERKIRLTPTLCLGYY